MILADTSVWVEHLDRAGRSGLESFLDSGSILIHPFVIGEIALGNVRHRERTLFLLRMLPKATVANHDEVLHFIEVTRLFGHGIGYVDAHLLVSTQLTADTTLWTHDRRLRAAAAKLNLAFLP